MNPTRVLVTGASGYIATHVVQQLQAAGYQVRGTVRSLKNLEKVDPLYKICPDAKYPLELVEADLMKPETWDSAVEGCTFVMHTASPFPPPGTSKDPENEIIKPAIQGTTSVIKACINARVKRVVLTSSVAAVSGSDNVPDGRAGTEDDWTDPEKCDPYTKSKTLAEKAAWDMLAQLPESEKIELSVINPVFVLGPMFAGTGAGSTSCGYIKSVLNGEMKELPSMRMSVVDVRDVAAAHVKAMTLPEAAGKRHILTSGTRLWSVEMAEIIAAEFNKMGYEVSTTGKKEGGNNLVLDNSRLTKVLGIQPYPARDTILAMAYALIEQGFVKKTPQYKGVPATF